MSTLFNSVNHDVSLAQNTLSAVTAVRSEGERSEAERITAVTASGETPDPEVVGRALRRRFTAAYKQRILTQADAYSSQLAVWRRARADAERAALRPKKRGPKPVPVNPLQAENTQLKSEMVRLQKKLRTAELMIDLQKKVSQILGITLIDESGGGEVNS